VYSGGNHGSDGISAIERICDRYNVNLVFNGHDHIYERSHQMYGQQISDDDSSLNAAAGTVYIVAGGGGAPLYTASRIDSTHTSKSTLHFVDVTTTSTTLTAKATRADGTVFDTFVISR
jgi:3',5'-cyclic AMP phosphodiesterase CpdA